MQYRNEPGYTLHKAALSLMIYSYVVRSTLNLAAFRIGNNSLLELGEPL